MRKVNDLEVVGNPADLDELMRRVEVRPDDRWRRARELEERLRQIPSMMSPWYYFSTDEGVGLPAATLSFEKWSSNQLVVHRIIPTERRPLTVAEYNDLLENFASRVIRPAADGLDVVIRMILPEERLERSNRGRALKELREFSRIADHEELAPSDWLRWKRFVIKSHLKGSLDAEELDWWLERNGWPERTRHQLVEAFKSDLSFLAEYDEERVPS